MKSGSNQIFSTYEITEGNMMEYLGVIEKNGNELVDTFNQSKSSNYIN